MRRDQQGHRAILRPSRQRAALCRKVPHLSPHSGGTEARNRTAEGTLPASAPRSREGGVRSGTLHRYEIVNNLLAI